MQRSRPAAPSSVADTGALSLPRELPSLPVLVEEVRSPGAARAEVDALIAGLGQPLPAGHSEPAARERADLLLALLADEQLGAVTGSQGRTVRTASIQALIALGYPYAFELPPEALSDLPPVARASADGLLSTRNGKLGFGLLAGLGVLLLLPVVAGAYFLSTGLVPMLIALLIICCLTVLPAGLTVAGHNLGRPALKVTGNVWLALVSVLWMVAGIGTMASDSAMGLVPLGVGLFTLLSTWLLNADT